GRSRRSERTRRHRCLLRVDPLRNAGPNPIGSTRRRHPPAEVARCARPATATPLCPACYGKATPSRLPRRSHAPPPAPSAQCRAPPPLRASSARHLPARSITPRSRVGEITLTRLCLGEGRALNCLGQLYNLGIEF